ncbi:MAG: PorP/SprF family type IX secretion system membrane protein [Flavobacteriales bacterium]
MQRTARSPIPAPRCSRRYRACILIALALGYAMLPTRVHAQDIHFSQFFHAPLALGPGFIGAFDGTHRFNAIHRQQWRAVTVPYSTFGLGWDHRSPWRGQRLGVGAWTYNDRAGDGRLNTFHFSLGVNWTQPLNSAAEHTLSFGGLMGFSSRTLDRTGLSFDAQYNGFFYDPQRPTGEGFERDAMLHPDLHAGIRYRWVRSPRSDVQLGASFFNLTSPRIGFLGGPGEPLDRRLDVHLLTSFPAGERLDVLPVARYMRQGTFHELDLGADMRHTLLHRYGLHRAVRFGLYLRARDAGYAHAALEFDDWTFGLSYDVNTSRLVPASRNRGGVELSAIYILRRKAAIPVRYGACPDQR